MSHDRLAHVGLRGSAFELREALREADRLGRAEEIMAQTFEADARAAEGQAEGPDGARAAGLRDGHGLDLIDGS